jgi:hypothetical protein
MKNAFYQDNPYLDYWKKEIDDESINKKVLNSLLKRGRKFEKILDIGTGSGVQIRRDIELGLLKDKGKIIGIDINKENLINSFASFEKWAKNNKYLIKKIDYQKALHKFKIKCKKKEYTIELYEQSVYNLGTNNSKFNDKFPLVTGLSLLEHTDIDKSLKAIKKVMIKNSFLYLTINYDQHSVFGPTSKSDFQQESNLMQLFNYVGIDYQFKGKVKTGNSHCGSLLPGLCKKAGFKVVDYGSSDWIILSGKVKPYTKNKRKALEFFVDAFYDVMINASQESKKLFNITDKQIEKWYELRKDQLNNNELYYSCIQKDILCKKV